MASTIKIKNSTTTGSAPSSLEQGEFAINVADGNLFYGDGSSVKQNFVFDDLTVKGNLTAEQYIVSSSVTYMTQSFSSGSTIFGDTLDDTHLFTGSVDITGQLSIPGFSDISASLASVVAGGDDLGNHTATQDLDMGTNAITNVGNVDGVDVSTLKSDFDTLEGKTLVSSSAQISFDSITDVPSGLLSSSADFATAAQGALADTAIQPADTGSFLTTVAFADITGKPTLISSSAQVDHDATTNFSADEHFTQSNITTVGTVTTGDVSAILPTGTVSGSSQIDLGLASGTIDISDQTNLAGGTNITLSDDTLNLDADISLTSITASGDISASGDIIANNAVITTQLTAAGIAYPTADGDNGDVLITDGAGNLSFARTTVYANVKNVHGSELVKGMPVHVTGAAGNTSEVIAASASNAATMPAHFILNETLADDEEGLAIAVGYINQVNTGDFSEGDTVYVGADGGYTNVKPTGSNLIQNLGIVDKVDASNGSGFILGAGRSNDVPNIASGYAWVGNSDQVATAVATSSFIPAGTISSSAQITITESQISDLTHYTDSDVKSKLNTEAVVSGSATQVRTFLNVEDGADVTDTANVTAAGALMDSEVTNLAQVKSFDSSDYATAAQGILADTAIQPSDTGSFLTTVAFADVTGKPTLISSSAQVDHDATTNFSADEHFTQANITTVGTVTSGDVSAILPSGTVSGSAQIDIDSTTGTITSAKISDVDAFSQSGTYASLRAQGTTAGDVGLGNVTNESKATMFTDAALTGNPTAPTPLTSDNDTSIATTAFVKAQGYTTNTGTVDTSGTPVDNDFAKFTDANTIEGRSYSEVKTDLSLNNVENTALSTYTGNGGALDNQYITNGAGYTTNTGTVTSVGGTGTVSGLSLSGTVTTSGNLTLGGTISISSTNITDVDAFSQTGTYASLRAQGTTAGDVGLGNVTNESKATMFTSPTFTGTTAAPTPSTSDDSTKIATTAYVQSNLDNLIGNAGAALDTLGELSASLADATGSIESLVTEIDGKLAKSSNLSDLTNTTTARTNLGVDAAGTDNSTDVTLAGSYDYITISGQQITRNQIDASTDISNLTTTNVSEGTNEYYTDAKVKTKLNTENVISGSASDVRTFLNVEDGADVTDTANVTAAGALMDSEITNLSQVKSFDSSDYATAAQGTKADTAIQPSQTGSFSTATGVEDNADVTDTANVTAAGALMDSEVTNLAQVKSFDSSDYATAAQGALADTAIQPADTGSFSTATGVEDNADVTDTANVTAAGALMDSEVTSLSLIKGLTAAQISGAFDAASASLASDIPTNNNQLTNGAGYTTNTGTVTSVGGTGTVSGLSLSGTVTTSGNLTLGGTISISSTNITDVDAFSQTGTYASLRAQGTTKGDVGLGNVENTALSTYTGNGGALDNQYITNGAGYLTSSPFTAAGISGSFTSVSASLASDIPTNNNQLTNGAGYITGYTVTSGDVTAHVGDIDHDSLLNFSADEHFTQANITTVGTVTSGDVSAILPTGTVSGSSQTIANISGQDITAENITANQTLRTAKTGSVTDPALLIGVNSGYLAGNNTGIILEDLVPGTTFFVPYFVSNGAKIFGFGTIMSMEKNIDMQSNRIYFDSDSTNTYIASNADDPEDLEIHADQDMLLSPDRYLIISGSRPGSSFAGIQLTGNITASGNISSSGTSDNFFGGRIVLDNANYIAGTETGGTTRNILSIDGSNITQVANGNLATNIKGTSITLANDTTIQGTLAIDGIANVSASIASAGGGGGGAVATYTNGSNDRIITSTGTDGINGEAALTFDGATLEVLARQEFTPSNAIRGIYTDIETNWESAVLVSSGEYIEVGADVSRTQHDLFNLSGSWSEANNGDVSTAIGLLGVAINSTSGNEWLVKGTFNIAQADLAGHPAEIGSPVYIGATNGKYTVTPPTSAGDVVRVVGHIADTYVSGRTTYYKIYFNPSPDWIEL